MLGTALSFFYASSLSEPDFLPRSVLGRPKSVAGNRFSAHRHGERGFCRWNVGYGAIRVVAPHGGVVWRAPGNTEPRRIYGMRILSSGAKPATTSVVRTPKPETKFRLLTKWPALTTSNSPLKTSSFWTNTSSEALVYAEDALRLAASKKSV